MRNPLLNVIGLFFFVVLLFLKTSCCFASSAQYDNYEAVPGLIDLRSTFSDGTHSIEGLARMAHSRGFKVIFINDHDRIALSYGIPPFRNILRYKKEYPSIMTHGPEKYLDEISRVSKKYPEIIIIPGCETSAYYYWTGSMFKKDLTVNNYDRRMIIINLDNPGDYNSIPNLHNSLSFRYTKKLIPRAVVLLVPLFIGLLLLRWKGFTRLIAFLIVILSIMTIIDYNPFRSSLFSPYCGDQGIAPYQELIDYVNGRGGLCFWNYPEQNSGTRKIDQNLPDLLSNLLKSIGLPDVAIGANTPPYSHVLHESNGYAGFAAIYGEYTTATDPGREWDRVLNEYCRAERDKAPWGISAADFHEDRHLNQGLGAFPTIFLVREFSKTGIIESIKNGRAYCSRGNGRVWLRLDYFNVFGKDGEKAFMGETLVAEKYPVIRFRISYNDQRLRSITIHLIRGGELLKTFTGETPMEIEYTDDKAPFHKKTYYRLTDNREHLVSNPIFVTYKPSSP